MKFNIETHKMMALSTTHLTKSTAELLDRIEDYDDISLTVYPKHIYGWFIPLEEESFEEHKNNYPPDLLNILEWALANGFSWVMFDRDVEEIELFPRFDW